MRRRRIAALIFVATFLLSPHFGVDACGPWFENDVFVRNKYPDDMAAFARGQLGILQAGFDSDEYAVAWRYLNGGKLSASEQAALAPPRNPNPDEQWEGNESALWLTMRGNYAPGSAPAGPANSNQAAPSIDVKGNYVYAGDYLNCPGPAFANAAVTLRKRADAWGKNSPWLADWILAQDAVFSNCEGKTPLMPRPAPAGSPALLAADRAYQTAAATFYARKFDEAAQQFAAISADKTSPWKDWGAYLAARATVRKAFAMGNATDPYSGDLASYDVDTMRRAQQNLEALLDEPHPAPSRDAIASELNFIRIRTEPARRVAEICAALAGPAPDPRFKQDLADLNWVLYKGGLKAPEGASANALQIDLKDLPPLLEWIAAWRGNGTATAAFDKWKQNHLLAWLVVALAKAAADDPLVPQLLSVAESIKPGTPAYDTVFFHRVRLLIGVHRNDEARALLDPAIASTIGRPPDSYRNALLGERMQIARDVKEFLADAPRTILEGSSQGAEDLHGQCNERAHAVNEPAPCPEAEHPPAFDDDAARILNQRLPLSRLIEAAHSPALPQNLRQEVAVIAWTRAVLMEDEKSAAVLAPLLPKPLGLSAASGTGFAASLAILRNPGIRPYLESGVARVASYSYFDELRDNWWCKPSVPAPDGSSQKAPALPPAPAFETSEELARADAESKRLEELPDSAAIIGQRVIDYARTHPDDPQVPEALHLTVRAGHYACQTYTYDAANPSPKSEYTAVSKAAFQLLHRKYPNSPWTTKTPYYY